MPKLEKPKYDHNRLKEDCDNYVNSVLAALAFINVLRWDATKKELRPSYLYEVGRRLKTSSGNEISPSTTVTPDVVVQCSQNLGVIGEVTLKLSTDREVWLEKLYQLKKYDDQLEGWWKSGHHVSNHDIALLVNLTRAVLVSDIIEFEQKKAQQLKEAANNTEGAVATEPETSAESRVESGPKALMFNRKVSVIGFERTSGATSEAITLKKEYGELTDVGVSQSLRGVVRVALEKLVLVYGDKQFVDHPPPEAYLLRLLWEILFTSYLGDEFVFNEELGYTPMPLSIERVTSDLRKYYGFEGSDDHSPRIPRRKWVQDAFDRLIQFDLAHIDGKQYVIHYRRFRGDPLAKFGKLLHDKGPLPSRKGTLFASSAGDDQGQ